MSLLKAPPEKYPQSVRTGKSFLKENMRNQLMVELSHKFLLQQKVDYLQLR